MLPCGHPSVKWSFFDYDYEHEHEHETGDVTHLKPSRIFLLVCIAPAYNIDHKHYKCFSGHLEDYSHFTHPKS